MDLKPYKVAIAQGDGLVARIGDVVIYIAEATAEAAPLLATVDAAAGMENSGTAVVKRLAAVAFSDDSSQIPAFGVIASTPEGLLLILRGPVTAEIGEEAATRKLAGNRAFTWVDELLRDPVETITIASARSESPIAASPHTDLRDGVVPGGGFVIQRTTTPAATPEMKRTATPEAKRAATPVVKPEATPEAKPAATPEAKPAVISTQPYPASKLLGGVGDQTTELIVRPQGGFTPPVDVPVNEPVVGVLASEDGTTYPLDRPYVIGRNPLVDAAVRDTKAAPIFVNDDLQISRVHVYVTVEEGVVMVNDAGTPAGTFVAAPGDQNWRRLGTSPTELKPGWSLRIGAQILTYHDASID